MTDRKLFRTHTLIDNFTQKLTKVETIDGGWSTKYVDMKTGLYWLKYIADDRSSSENLMLISPPLATDDLINISFTSKYPDEVSAAATRLYIEEQVDKKEFRQKLLSRLTYIDISKIDQAEKERVKNVIQASQLANRVNKRDIVGKHFTEIQKDAAYFNSIADSAQNILKLLY